MLKIDYDQLYQLLYYMNNTTSLNELAQKLFFSPAKTSKMIKSYELKLNTQLFVKTDDCILSNCGQKLLVEMAEPLFKLRELVNDENKTVGIEENLIEDKISIDNPKRYIDSEKLIDMYNSGIIDKMIISEDYDNRFRYMQKEPIITKPVYRISNLKTTNPTVFATGYSSPITEKLKSNEINIDQFLNQSVAICQMVRQGKGCGYTFSTDTLDPQFIKIEPILELEINYYLYSKY